MKQSLPNQTTNIMKNFENVRVRTTAPVMAFILFFAALFNTAQAQTPTLGGDRKIEWRVGERIMSKDELQTLLGGQTSGIITLPVYITIPANSFPSGAAIRLQSGAMNFEIREMDEVTQMSHNWKAMYGSPGPVIARHLYPKLQFQLAHEPTANALIIDAANFDDDGDRVGREATYGGTLTHWLGSVSLAGNNLGGNGQAVRLFDFPVYIEELGSFRLCINPNTMWDQCPSFITDGKNCPEMGNMIIAFTTTGIAQIQSPEGYTNFMWGAGGLHEPHKYNTFVCGGITMLGAPEIDLSFSSLCPYDTSGVYISVVDPAGGSMDEVVVEYSHTPSNAGSWLPLSGVAGVTPVLPVGFNSPYEAKYELSSDLMAPGSALAGATIRVRARVGAEWGEESAVLALLPGTRHPVTRRHNVTGDPIPQIAPEISRSGDHQRTYAAAIGDQVMLVAGLGANPSQSTPAVVYSRLNSAGGWDEITAGANNTAIFSAPRSGTYIGRNLQGSCWIPTDTVVVLSRMSVTVSLDGVACPDTEFGGLRVHVDNPWGDPVNPNLVKFTSYGETDFTGNGEHDHSLLFSPAPGSASTAFTTTPWQFILDEVLITDMEGDFDIEVHVWDPTFEEWIEAPIEIKYDDVPLFIRPYTAASGGSPATGTGTGVVPFACGEMFHLKFEGASGGRNLTDFLTNYSVFYNASTTYPIPGVDAPVASGISLPTFLVTPALNNRWVITGMSKNGCFTRRDIIPGGVGCGPISIATNAYGEAACNDTIMLVGRFPFNPSMTFDYWSWWLVNTETFYQVDNEEGAILYSLQSFGDVIQPEKNTFTDYNNYIDGWIPPLVVHDFQTHSNFNLLKVDAKVAGDMRRLDTLIISIRDQSSTASRNAGRAQLQRFIDMQNGDWHILVNANFKDNYEFDPDADWSDYFDATFGYSEATETFWPDVLGQMTQFYIQLPQPLIQGNLPDYERPDFNIVLPNAWIVSSVGGVIQSGNLAQLTPSNADTAFIWVQNPPLPNLSSTINGYNNWDYMFDVLRPHLQYSSNSPDGPWVDFNTAVFSASTRVNPANPDNYYRIQYRFEQTPSCMPRSGNIAHIIVASGERIGTLTESKAIICGNEAITITNSGPALISMYRYEYQINSNAWVIPPSLTDGLPPTSIALSAIMNVGTLSDGDVVRVRLFGIGEETGEPHTSNTVVMTYRANPSGNTVLPHVGVCVPAAGTTVTFSTTPTSGAGNTGLTFNWSATAAGITHSSGSTFSVTAPSAFAGGNRTVQVIVTNEHGCTQTENGSVAVFATPVITGLPATDITRCFFEPLLYTANVSPSSTNYTYSWTNDTSTSATLNLPAPATPSPSPGTTYTLTVQRDLAASGVVGPACPNTAMVRVITNDDKHINCEIPTTVVLTSGSTTSPQCYGDFEYVYITATNDLNEAVKYIVIETEHTMYMQDPPDNVGGDNYRIPKNNFDDGVNRIIVYFASSEGEVSFTQDPKPQINSVSITPICAGGDVIFTGAASDGATFYFGSDEDFSDYGSNLASGAALTGEVLKTVAGSPHTVHVFAETSVGCKSDPTTVQYTVKAIPAPSIALAGPDPICNLYQYTLTVTHEDGATYVWRRDGNVINAGGYYSFNTNRNELTLAPGWENGGTGGYAVAMTVDGCTGTATRNDITSDCGDISITIDGTPTNTSRCYGVSSTDVVINVRSALPIDKIMVGTETLVAGTNYTVVDVVAPNRTITINGSYLATLSSSTTPYEFIIYNDAGESCSVNITINALPGTVSSATAPAVCINGQPTFTVATNAPAAATFRFGSDDGGLSDYGSGASPFTLNSTPTSTAGSKTVWITPISGAGCVGTSSSYTFDVTANPAAVALTTSPANPVCIGTTVTVGADRALLATETLTITIPGISAQTLTLASSTYTFTAAAANHGNITGTIQNAGCPTSPVPATQVNLVVATAATAGAGTMDPASGSVCQHQNGPALTLTQGTFDNNAFDQIIRWERQVNAGLWETINNTTTSFAGEQMNTVGTVNYRAIVKYVCGAEVASVAAPITVNAAPGKPEIEFNSANTYCLGTAVGVSLKDNPAGTITWIPSNFTWTTPGTANTASIPTTGFNTTTTYSLTATVTVGSEPNQCTSLASDPVTFTLLPVSPDITISGIDRNSVCVGEEITITFSRAMIAADEDWAWTSLPSSVTADPVVETSDATKYKFTTTGGGTGQTITLTVTPKNGCPASIVRTTPAFTVTQLPPQPTITLGSENPPTVCEGSALSVSVGTITGTVAYTSSFGWTGSGASTSIPDTYTSPLETDGTTYTVNAIVTNNGCQSPQASATFTVLPTAGNDVTFALDAPTTVCPNTAIGITTSRAPASHEIFSWTPAAITGSGTSWELPAASVTASGTVTMRVTTNNGCAQATANAGVTGTGTHSYTVQTIGAASIAITDGALTFCDAATSATGGTTRPTFTASSTGTAVPTGFAWRSATSASGPWTGPVLGTDETFTPAETDLEPNVPTFFQVTITICAPETRTAVTGAVTRVVVVEPTFTTLPAAPAAVCQDDNVAITGTSTLATSTVYTWTGGTRTGNFSIAAPNVGDETLPGSGRVNWVITATNTQNGCTRTTNQTVEVMRTPVLPTLAYSGDLTVCHGTRLEEISISNSGAYTQIASTLTAFIQIDSMGTYETMSNLDGNSELTSIESAVGWIYNSANRPLLNNTGTSNRTIRFRVRANYGVCGIQNSLPVEVTVVGFAPDPVNPRGNGICLGATQTTLLADLADGGLFPRYEGVGLGGSAAVSSIGVVSGANTLTAGDHNFRVRAERGTTGCFSEWVPGTFRIEAPPANLVITDIDVVCAGTPTLATVTFNEIDIVSGANLTWVVTGGGGNDNNANPQTTPFQVTVERAGTVSVFQTQNHTAPNNFSCQSTATNFDLKLGAASPTPSFSFARNTGVCRGTEKLQITIPESVGGTNYKLSWPGGTPIEEDTHTEVEDAFNALNLTLTDLSTRFTLEVAYNEMCPPTRTVNVDVATVALPTIGTPSLTNSGTVCEGTTINLSVGAGAGSQITLIDMSPGLTFSSTGPFTSTATPTINTTGMSGAYAFTVRAAASSAAGACVSYLDNVTITVNDRPSITSITQTDPVCRFEPITLTAVTDPVEDVTVSWSPAITGATTGAKTYSLLAGWTPATFTATVTDDNGCTNTNTIAIQERGTCEDTPEITAITDKCKEDLAGETHLDVTVTSNIEITYFRNNGGANITDFEGPVTFETGAANVYRIPITHFVDRPTQNSLVAYNPGGNSSAATFFITPQPAAPTTVTGGNICYNSGDDVQLSASGTAGTATQWEFSSSLFPTQTVTGATGTVNVSGLSTLAVANNHAFSARYMANGCWSAAGNGTFEIKKIPEALDLSGLTSAICENATTITFGTDRNFETGETPTWTGISSATYNAGEFTANTPSASFTNGVGTVSIGVFTTLRECVSEASNTITLTVHQQGAKPTIGGATQICVDGTMGNLEITSSSSHGQRSYVWQRNGATIVDGTNDLGFATESAAEGWFGTYSGRTIDAAGTVRFNILASFGACPAIASDEVTITVHNNPTKPVITYDGPSTGCAGDFDAAKIDLVTSNANTLTWFNCTNSTTCVSGGDPITGTITGGGTTAVLNISDVVLQTGHNAFRAAVQFIPSGLTSTQALAAGCVIEESDDVATFEVTDGLLFNPTGLTLESATSICHGGSVTVRVNRRIDDNFDRVIWETRTGSAGNWGAGWQPQGAEDVFSPSTAVAADHVERVFNNVQYGPTFQVRARIYLDGGGCLEIPVTINTVAVTVYQTPDPGTISSGGTICHGSDFNSAITLSGSVGDEFKWFIQSNPTAIATTTTPTLPAGTIQNVTAQTLVYVEATNGACTTPVSSLPDVATINLYVEPTIDVALAVDENKACQGSQVELSVEASSTDAGTISYKWFYSIEYPYDWVAFGAAADEQMAEYPSGQTADSIRVYYKVEAFSGNASQQCESTKVTSDVVYVDWFRTVRDPLITLDPDGTTCIGLVDVEFTASSTFTFEKWELSGGIGEFATTAVADYTFTDDDDFTFTAFFKNGACTGSITKDITIIKAPIAQNIEAVTPADAILCGVGATLQLKVDDDSYGTITWQISSDGGATFANLAGATNLATITTATTASTANSLIVPTGSTLETTYLIRAQFGNQSVTTGNCAVKESNTVSVTVFAQPQISAVTYTTPVNVCKTAGAITATLTSQPTTLIGETWQWEMQVTPSGGAAGGWNLLGGSATDIADGAITEYVHNAGGDLTVGTYEFRLRIKNGTGTVCTDATSAILSVRVWDVPVVGTITPTDNLICQYLSETFGTSGTNDFGVGATQSETSHRWTLDGVPIAGATGTSLTHAFNDLGSFEINLELSNPGCASWVSGTSVDVEVISSFTLPTMVITTTGPICAGTNSIAFSITDIPAGADHIEIRQVAVGGSTTYTTHEIPDPLVEPMLFTLENVAAGNYNYSARAIVLAAAEETCFKSDNWTPEENFRVDAPIDASGDLRWASGTALIDIPFGQNTEAMQFVSGNSTYQASNTISDIDFFAEFRIDGNDGTIDEFAGSTDWTRFGHPGTSTSASAFAGAEYIEFRVTITSAGCAPTAASTTNWVRVNIMASEEIIIVAPAQACEGKEIDLKLGAEDDVFLPANSLSGIWRWERWDKNIKGGVTDGIQTGGDDIGVYALGSEIFGEEIKFTVEEAGFYHFIFDYTSPLVNTGNPTSDTAVVQVHSATRSGSILPTAQEICQGQTPEDLILGGDRNGAILRWEFSETDTWPGTTRVNITSTHTPADSGYYRAIVQNSTFCDVESTASVLVEIFSPTVAGTITPADQEACSDALASLDDLELDGNTGRILRWEFSANNSANEADWTPINNTTATLLKAHFTSVADSGHYRAVVQSGEKCDILKTDPVLVEIFRPTVAGTIVSSAGDNNICSGHPANISFETAPIGTVTGWQFAPVSNLTNWQPVTANEAEDPLTGTTLTLKTIEEFDGWFRAVVKHGACTSVETPEVAIKILPGDFDATLSSDKPLVRFGEGFTITLSGPNRNLDMIWQDSIPSSTEWSAPFDPTTQFTFVVADELTEGKRWFRVQTERSDGSTCLEIRMVHVQSFDTLVLATIPTYNRPASDQTDDITFTVNIGSSEQGNYPDTEFALINLTGVEFEWFVCDPDGTDCTNPLNWTSLTGTIPGISGATTSSLKVESDLFEEGGDYYGWEYFLVVTSTQNVVNEFPVGPFTIMYSKELAIAPLTLAYIPTGYDINIAPTITGDFPGVSDYIWTWTGATDPDEPLNMGDFDWIKSITNGVITINITAEHEETYNLHGTSLILCVDNNDLTDTVCVTIDLQVLLIPEITISSITVCEGDDAPFTISYSNDRDKDKFDITWRVNTAAVTGEEDPSFTIEDTEFSDNNKKIIAEIRPNVTLQININSDLPIESNEATLTVIEDADLGTIFGGDLMMLAYSVKTFDLNMTPGGSPEAFTWQYTTTDPSDLLTVWTPLTGQDETTLDVTDITEITDVFPGRIWFRAVGNVGAEYGCPRIAGPIEVRSFDTLVWLAGGTTSDVPAKGDVDATLTGIAGSIGDPEVFIELVASNITYQWQMKCEITGDFEDIDEIATGMENSQTSTLTVPIAWYTDEDNFNCSLRLVATWTHAAVLNPVEIIKGPFQVIFSEDLEVNPAVLIGCIPVDSIVEITATYVGFADENTWIWVDGNDVEHRLSVGNPAWVVGIENDDNPAIQSSTIRIRGNLVLDGTKLKLEIKDTDSQETAVHEDGEEFELCVIKIPSNITVNSLTVCENSTGGTAVFTINTNDETIEWNRGFEIEWYVNDDLQVGEDGLSFTISPTPLSRDGAIVRAEITPTVDLEVALDTDLFAPIKAQGVLTVVYGFDMIHPKDTSVCRGQSAEFSVEGNYYKGGSTFQWFNQADVQVSTAPVWVVPTDIESPDNRFYYRITNEWCGSWTSDPATLTVLGVNASDFNVNNAGLICYDGRSRTVVYTAALNNTTDYKYDWKINNESVPSGNENASYNWLGITDADHGKEISLWITAIDAGNSAANCGEIRVWGEELQIINSNLLEILIGKTDSPICGETYETLLTAQNFFPGDVEWSVPAPAEWQYNADDNLYEGFGVFNPQATPYHITLTITQGGVGNLCVGLATVDIFVPQSIPLGLVVDGDTIEERPIVIVLEEPGSSVDLAVTTDGRTGVTFLWEVLSTEQLPEYDLDGTKTDSTIKTAVFDATFQTNNWTQEIKITATDEANGCVSVDTIRIKVKSAFALDSLLITVNRLFPTPSTVFETVVVDREPGTDNFTDELLLCHNHIIYFAPRITGGTPPFKVTWTSVPGSDVYENDQFVKETPHTIPVIEDSLTLVNTNIGFQASIAATYSIIIEDADGAVVRGNLTAGVREAPEMSMLVVPDLVKDNNNYFYENQPIRIMISGSNPAMFWHPGDEVPEVWTENPMFDLGYKSGTVRNHPDTDDSNRLHISVIGAVKDQFGCEAMDTITLRLLPTPSILIPDDPFYPLNRVLFPDYQVEVFNVWGLRLQSFSPGRLGWDATHNGREVRSGTYYYNVRIPNLTGGGYATFHGAVTVVRYNEQ
jgi:hypothetical protein